MSIDLGVSYLITAPAGQDGYGEIAQLNGLTTDANFVGYLTDLTFAREVRENADDITDGHGGVHGPFYSGRLPFTMEVQIIRGLTYTASNVRADKLIAAFDAHTADGSIVWTETGRVTTRILFRQQQSPRGPDKEGKVLLAGVSASPLILSNATPTPTALGSGLQNVGKAATFPSFAFTTPGSAGTVTLSRTSPSPTESLLLTVGGTNGLATSTATTVDFEARTVLQGSTNKYGAVQFPASVWWMMAPGANTLSSSGGATSVTVTWRSAWRP